MAIYELSPASYDELNNYLEPDYTPRANYREPGYYSDPTAYNALTTVDGG
jgi:hypothetical protein